MDDPKGTIGRATILLRYLCALRRDARTAGPDTPAAAFWEREMIRQMPRLMALLAEACGLDLER
ncbi:MAG: hypothetical protein JWO38_6113 [Gemmataceae bacterium]|nr:hypothetical protein [Gemmataceae bacterium]